MKKRIIALAMSALMVNTVFSMEGSQEGLKKELIEGVKGLPKELRGQVVSLALESKIADEYRPFNKIVAGDSISSIAFSPDGKAILIVVLAGHIARLWDLHTLQELKRFTGFSDRVSSVVFSPDGKTFLTGSDDGIARLWDTATGQELKRFSGSTSPINSVAFSPDGRTFLTGSDDGIARLWDTATEQELKQFIGHTIFINSVAFSPDGKTVLTGSNDKTARLWDVDTGEELKKFAGHTAPVVSVAFSPDGRTVLTGSRDGTARLWDIATAQELRRFDANLHWLMNSPVVTFSPDGKTILTGSYTGTVTLWDTATGKKLQNFIGCTEVYSGGFSPDGNIIAIGGSCNVLYLFRRDFRLEQGSPLYSELKEKAYEEFKTKGLSHVLANPSTETTEESQSS